MGDIRAPAGLPSPLPSGGEFPVVNEGHTPASVTDLITGLVFQRRYELFFYGGLFLAFLLVNVMLLTFTYLLIRGVGIWGINRPVMWGFAIANFVWWIGIGHAGTFISAILYLMHQEWRTSINRFAEAMTLFAVTCAGLFPLFHMGRPWYFYWLLPYPDTMDLWPQWRSPLVWDVFAVSTYLTISTVFWYIGLIPDAASMRDKATHPFLQRYYGILALGWRGSARHWGRYQMAYLLLAALATPLVLSVHSVVGMDFTGTILPGWHSTMIPPYFVAGAIFSGFAMVLTLGIPIRAFLGLEDFITRRHLENCAKLMLVTGLIVDYAYLMEFFMAWYSDDRFEKAIELNRVIGAYWPGFLVMMIGNVLSPQLLWLRKVRTTAWMLFVISLLVQAGMWFERYVIVVQSLHHDFLPSSWAMYHPTVWDFGALFGTIGLFFLLFLIFVRSMPIIAMAELRELVFEKAREKARGRQSYDPHDSHDPHDR